MKGLRCSLVLQILPLLVLSGVFPNAFAKSPSAASATTKIGQQHSGPPVHPSPDESLDWKAFGFGLNDVKTDFIWLDCVQVSTSANNFEYSTNPNKCLVPMQDLVLSPSSTVLNYGQSLFEGLKAFRREDGNIVVFRPDLNAERLVNGAKRLLMMPPLLSTDTFLKAVEHVVRSNARFVPPCGEGALYLRPLLFGSGIGLGVKPSTEVTFCIYASPVGNYFKSKALKCIRLQAVKGYARAAPGGSGCIKAAGNYASAFLVQREVRERGFDEALFLDSTSGKNVEEAGASNFFAIFHKDKTIVTPPIAPETDTILPGITRASLIELAQSELAGWKVEERSLSIYELKDASEAFCCGTGASVTPVGYVSYCTKKCDDQDALEVEFDVVFGDGITPGPVTAKLYSLINGIQNGAHITRDILEKYKHWIHIIEP